MENENTIELKKIQEEFEFKKIPLQELMEEKTSDFQKKILNHKGELIGAVTKSYESWRTLSCPIETLYTGIITSKTKFNINPTQSYFLTGIENSYYIQINEEKSEFKKDVGKGFCNPDIDTLRLIYFRDEPPVKTGKLKDYSKKIKRLELLIGNEEVIPMLKKLLRENQYNQILKLLKEKDKI